MADSPEKSPESPLRFSLAYYAVLMGVMFALQSFFFSDPQGKEIPYSEFLARVEADRVAKVTIAGDHIFGVLKAPKGTPAGKGEEDTLHAAADKTPFSIPCGSAPMQPIMTPGFSCNSIAKGFAWSGLSVSRTAAKNSSA